MLKKHSSTTVRSAQHPNTGRNMQQMGGSQIPVSRFAFNKKNNSTKQKQRSTLTAGLSIQTALAKALDQGEFVLMASLDLSSAFDVVNIDLLIKRLKNNRIT